MKSKSIMLAFLLLPATFTLNAQLGKALKALKPSKHLADQGITNATHQKYVGQIVWSNEKISLETPDEAKFKTHFASGEMIYGRFYLGESLQNFIYSEKKEIKQGFTYFFDVYIDGVMLKDGIGYTNIGDDYNTSTTRQTRIHIPRNNDDAGQSAIWVNMVNKSMTPGEHTVKFDLRIKGCDGVAASGGFTYVKGNEPVKYGWNFENYTKDMSDAALEAEILKCIQKYATTNGWKESFKQVKIHSSDWYIIKNENTGVITDRSLNAYCMATWPDGHCTVQSFTFSQQYIGSGYSKTFSLYSIGKQEVCDCN